jgi:hypothetical protein
MRMPPGSSHSARGGFVPHRPHSAVGHKRNSAACCIGQAPFRLGRPLAEAQGVLPPPVDTPPEPISSPRREQAPPSIHHALLNDRARVEWDRWPYLPS